MVFMIHYERQVCLSTWPVLKFMSLSLSIRGYLANQFSRGSGKIGYHRPIKGGADNLVPGVLHIPTFCDYILLPTDLKNREWGSVYAYFPCEMNHGAEGVG